jgi:hypothetical protein
MLQIDLTPVGFTPTESLAYSALLDRGPSSGYAVGKALGIARANAYQALNGLVTKGAAVLVGDTPLRFRAVSPQTLLALVAERESRKLDTLERQVASLGGPAKPATVPFHGRRQFEQLALRTATRAAGRVTCIAPAPLLEALTPIWRRRGADGATTELWSIGSRPAGLSLELAGELTSETARSRFPADPALVISETAVIAALSQPDFPGYWTTDPLLVAALRTTADYLIHQ